MDKTAIKNFAIEARKTLMKSAITEAGFYGVTKDGCKSPIQKGSDFEVYETLAGTENRIFGDDIKRRANLVRAVEEQGFEQVIEETAYTWFNRIVAIRFMEINNYLPTRVRVLSSEAGGSTPDIVTQADTVELNLTSDELDKIRDAKTDNRYDDAFRLLFIKQCNELNAILPGLFEKTDDYMELLLKISYTADGVIRMLIDSIPESNFNVETEGQVEIIGWMYQYYNTELKDDTFAKLKKNVKITKERIPAATQLFTPDWIVRYMVENSLGRVWIEHLRAVDSSVDEKAKAEEFGWKYYLPEAEQEEDVAAQLVEIRKSYKDLTPQDITCIDPCMGSGHILVYMFDVLMDIYRSEGFSERESVFDILEKNIRGLDIDRRAYQLSYFALMMKARGYNRIFFRGHEDIDGNRVQAVPRVYAIEESNSIERDHLTFYGAGLDEMQKNNAINQMNGLLDTLHDAKEYGSILNVENYDWELLHSFVDEFDNSGQMSLVGFVAGRSQILLKKLVNIGEILARKYDAVVTNPPYLGSNGLSIVLTDYLKHTFPNSKSDLFAVFIERSIDLSKKYGFAAIIAMQSWMFLSSYEDMRFNLLNGCFIESLLHLGIKAFEEIGNDVVQTATFVIRKNAITSFKGTYFKLLMHDRAEKQSAFLNRKADITFVIDQSKLLKIPGQPIAFWVSDHVIDAFQNFQTLGEVSEPKQGIATADNNRFLRLWYEVCINDIAFDCRNGEDAVKSGKKWFPYQKGGDYRKWYGNNNYVVLWENNGAEIKRFKAAVVRNPDYHLKTGLTWTWISTGYFGARLSDRGSVFDVAGSTLFTNQENMLCLLGYLCSNVADYLLKIMNPTINYSNGVISKLPISLDVTDHLKELVEENIVLSRDDWNIKEQSWDFIRHPLVDGEKGGLKDKVQLFIQKRQNAFDEQKRKEEEINEEFIRIFKFEEDVKNEVDPHEIKIYIPTEQEAIKTLISYSVGCMFGRYSLTEPGLVFAGGKFDEKKYGEFQADRDSIIPITDEQYFDDDIVGRFEDFIKLVFGEESLEGNLEYIAETLKVKGNSSREKIRYYFLNDFYKDHCNAYSVTGSGKRPIYWLFDSGKQNGFKCLIYMHRYTPDTVGLIRSDYLTKAQSMIENALKNAEYAINTSGSAVDRAQATKKRDKYIKQLAEIRAYYPALSHIALQRIDLDLDDGVKANYEKFQGIEISVEGEKKQKIDLLAKI